MKLPNIKKLLTPAVSPDARLKKAREAAALAGTNPGGTSGSRSGGGAPRSFSDYYTEVSAYFTPETVSYSPLDAGAISALLAKSLRPVYDSAIARRRETTAAYNANLDADAYARGIGSSTYVTDVKQRNYRDESRDVETLESSYGAQLAEKLYDALAAQSKQQLEVDKFNAEQINNAASRAYSAATALFNASKSSGSSGAAKTADAESALPALSFRKQLAVNAKNTAAYEKIPTVSAEDAETYWQRLSPDLRSALLNADSTDGIRVLATIEKSVGTNRFRELLQEYPAAQ